MNDFFLSVFKKDIWLTLSIFVLVGFGVLTLRSVAPSIFPLYYLYLVVAVAAFFLFANLEFGILAAFSKHLYALSIIFLLLPPILGQVTRGVVRWVPLGTLTIQPAEIVRPFLILFFAYFLTREEVGAKRLLYSLGYLALPIFLILIQPSLGVTVLTFVGFLGVLLSSGLSKRAFLALFVIGALLLPTTWLFLAPYQRDRVTNFLFPERDPAGAGYNSIQSMISVGSGSLWGRGLGQGVQTQLAFLPERHSDFIFASIAEELGFFGAGILLLVLFFLFIRVVAILDQAVNYQARAFISGTFLSLLAQTIVHVGMNMGLFPITGLPLPLVSAGGSSFLATMIALGMVISAKK